MKIQNKFKLRPIGALVATLFVAGSVQAGDFTMDNGVEGRWSLNASVGTSIRAKDADKRLIMPGNGGVGTAAGYGNAAQDDGNLNFQKGDSFSTIGKLLGELDLKRDNLGLFLRGKAWYDYQLADKSVPHGSSANGYQPNTKLNDAAFDRLSKFSGAEILDAYVSVNTYVGKDSPVTVKVGNQVVNWGESLFTPGINQYNAFDISAARKPGTEIKEILLPIPQISFNLGVAENTSLEAFYQFAWKKSILDGCGTYWATVNTYNCSASGSVVSSGPFQNKTSFFNYSNLTTTVFSPTGANLGAVNALMRNGGTVDGKDSGQWGLAGRYFSPELSTEFGAYYINYNQRSPILSLLLDKSTSTQSVYGGAPPFFQMSYAWDYSAQDIQVLGLSASTNVSGWSVFGEASYTKDLPAQINGPDLLNGAAQALGPMGYLRGSGPTFGRNQGTLIHGYGLLDKNQIQIATIKSFPRVLGAESLGVAGEIAYQNWKGIGDPTNSVRYGRGFVFGQAVSTAPGTPAGLSPATMTNPETEGFATKNAWGYKARLELSYPNLFAGVNVKPRVFFSHDVDGYSADNTFVKNRKSLGLGTRFDYLGKYYADISLNKFNSNAAYDIYRDRDFYSAVVGMNF